MKWMRKEGRHEEKDDKEWERRSKGSFSVDSDGTRMTMEAYLLSIFTRRIY